MAKIGRPSKYKEEYIQEVDKYLKEAIPENMDIPMVEGLALRLKVSKQAIYRWAKKNKKFRNALGKLKAQQKVHLVKIGIFGGKEINASIVALMLKVNHDMIEKTGLELSGKDGVPLGVVVLPKLNEKRNLETSSRASDRGS